MELLLSPLHAALATLALITCFISFYFIPKSPTKTRPPMAAGGWPLLGHLSLLSGPDPLHITLSNMAEKYGPIFTVQLGTRPALIVNTHEGAKACFRTNDLAFSNRPKTAAIGLMGYNFAMLGFSDYGPYWREMRKISVTRLLSHRKVNALTNLREVQIGAVMRSLTEGPTLDMRKFFGDVSLKLMIRTVAGDVEEKMDLVEKERWRRSIREFFKMMTVFTVSDVVPFLKWVDYFGGMHRIFEKTGRDFDAMLQSWLDDHKKREKSACEDGEDDFMEEMMRVVDGVSDEFPCYDADTINKATCLTMMVGGTDTTSVTLTWSLCLLLNNPHTLKRAQEELENHVGRERPVKESDLENLAYIGAVIKEAMRLQPPVPIIPREAGEDCVVLGYQIPAGTRLFINTWSIQRDPRVWPDPLEFRPERFMSSHKEVDLQGLHFELVPFGGGRRVCPAIPFALRTMQLALASLLHGFHVEMAVEGEAVDMRGSFGTTNMKATPLEVRLTPRLSPEIYG